MNVLSLFDGMSCGQIALKKLGIPVGFYMASEIDRHSIEIAAKNFPNTLLLGDVKEVGQKMYVDHEKGVSTLILPKIDLLLGGSPCQGFSFLGKQLDFEDPRSKLFFEYVRILKEVKPKYFLLENVKMKKASEDIITEHLGVEPIEINSSLVSAQNRRRLYWTNIPVEQPEDLDIKMKNIVRWSRSTRYPKGQASYVESRAYMDGKSNTLLTGDGCSTFSSKSMILDNACKLRKLTPNECEFLQTVPEDYTAGVSDHQRYRMLGNGWTVDVIAHILKGMKL